MNLTHPIPAPLYTRCSVTKDKNKEWAMHPLRAWELPWGICLVTVADKSATRVTRVWQTRVWWTLVWSSGQFLCTYPHMHTHPATPSMCSSRVNNVNQWCYHSLPAEGNRLQVLHTFTYCLRVAQGKPLYIPLHIYPSACFYICASLQKHYFSCFFINDVLSSYPPILPTSLTKHFLSPHLILQTTVR